MWLSHHGKQILSSGNGCLGCFQFLAVMNKAAVNIHKVFCGHIFSFLLVKCTGVELLGCMVSMCLTLYETIQLKVLFF